ncbi:family 16 glycosylhydrolase [Methylobacterium sp. A54F]
MPIDPNDLARTAVLTYDAEFDTFDLWDGSTGLDTAGGPQWAWSTSATGTMPYNQEQQFYVRADAAAAAGLPNPFSVADGVLTIRAAPADPALGASLGGQAYTSGLINTFHDFSQTYGYFEMRAELPAGQGIWPAFWLLPTDGSWPPEIDVMEVLGDAPGTLYTTVHSEASGAVAFPDGRYQSQGITQVGDTSDGFHTYGVDWQPDSLTWYFDGREVYRTATPADLDGPMYMIANLAVGGTWPGSPDATTPFPAEMRIDYLRAYRAVTGDAPGFDPVYHLYDAGTGQHFFTANPEERDAVAQLYPGYAEQGVAWAAPEPGAGTQDVFRFLDTRTGDRFYTQSAAERDYILGTLPDYAFEGVAFQAFADPAAAGAAAVTVERFVNTQTGRHYFASSEAEAAHLEGGAAGPGWTLEGPAFTLAAPAAMG